jgi:hypothetical protein
MKSFDDYKNNAKTQYLKDLRKFFKTEVEELIYLGFEEGESDSPELYFMNLEGLVNFHVQMRVDDLSRKIFNLQVDREEEPYYEAYYEPIEWAHLLRKIEEYSKVTVKTKKFVLECAYLSNSYEPTANDILEFFTDETYGVDITDSY